MTKPEIDLGVEVIKYTFEKLPVQDRLKVVADLEKITRRQRWDSLIKKIRGRVSKTPISQKEINRLCEETRQQHEQRAKSSN